MRDFLGDKRDPKNGWAPGDYYNKCHSCSEQFIGDKRAMTCSDCAYDESIFPPKPIEIAEYPDRCICAWDFIGVAPKVVIDGETAVFNPVEVERWTYCPFCGFELERDIKPKVVLYSTPKGKDYFKGFFDSM